MSDMLLILEPRGQRAERGAAAGQQVYAQMLQRLGCAEATADSEADIFPTDDALMAEMTAYHEALQQAGVLLDGNGLQPSSKSWRIHYGSDGQRSVVDGPFAETQELVAGYTVIQVRSRDEAKEWARRFPAPMGAGVAATIELRPMYELEDFPQTDSINRLRALDHVSR